MWSNEDDESNPTGISGLIISWLSDVFFGEKCIFWLFSLFLCIYVSVLKTATLAYRLKNMNNIVTFFFFKI